MRSLLLCSVGLGVHASNASSPARRIDICDSIHVFQCNGEDVEHVGPVDSHDECCNRCKHNRDCNAWTWNWLKGKHCYLKSSCEDIKHTYGYHSGVQPIGPTPVPTPMPPTPAPEPTSENPLGIVPAPNREDNYFLIIGDWGAPTDERWAHSSGGCQAKVASLMKSYVTKYKEQGKKCLFVAAVGDNFYASGLKDDDHFRKQWHDYYGTLDSSSALYDIPWLAVMGNHDMGTDDHECACGKYCKQFNGPHRPAGTEKFWMPDYYWHYYIDEVKLEVIGLDTNAVDAKSLGGAGCKSCESACGGFDAMQSWLNTKANDGIKYVEERAQTSEATTVLLIQHYNWGWNQNMGALVKTKFDSWSQGKAKSLSAYGHAHDQKCEGSKTYGCDVILTGGGGGWKGGAYFGFTAVHLTADGGYQTVLESDEVRFSQHACQYLSHEEPTENTSFPMGEVVV